MYGYFASVHVCVPYARLVPTEAKRGCWIPLGWSHELSRGCWKLSQGPLDEQPALLTAEPSLEPPKVFYVSSRKLETSHLIIIYQFNGLL